MLVNYYETLGRVVWLLVSTGAREMECGEAVIYCLRVLRHRPRTFFVGLLGSISQKLQ